MSAEMAGLTWEAASELERELEERVYGVPAAMVSARPEPDPVCIHLELFFWRTWEAGVTPVQQTSMPGLTGRAAFAAYSGTGSSHLLAWATGADVEISPIDCTTTGGTGCELPARPATWPTS